MSIDVKTVFKQAKLRGADKRQQPQLVAELALWSAMVDGHLGGPELDVVAGVLRQIPTLEHFGAPDVLQMLGDMSTRYSDADAIANRMNEVAAAIVDPQLQRVSYALALMCASSDGHFSDLEASFLADLQTTFRISDAEAKQLVQDVFTA